MPTRKSRLGGPQTGLTLIELVVAISVIAIASTAIMLLLMSGFGSSPDPQLRIKAVELGQSYMDEVFAKAYADPDGNDTETVRQDFDDVDDYGGLREGTECGYPDPLRNASGGTRSGRYNGFCVTVTVSTGVGGELRNVSPNDAKRIDVEVTGPRDLTTAFTAYRLDI